MTATLPAVLDSQPPANLRLPKPPEVLAAFLTRRSPRTREAYDGDLRDLAAHVGVAGGALGAIEFLARLAGPEANAVALSWRTALVERGLAPGTVNRRLSSLRSVARLMRTVGVVAWTLEVEGERAGRLRDTRGPAEAGVAGLLRVARSQRDPWKAARDAAIVRTIYDLALRRGEVVTLDLCHALLADDPPALLVHGKGETGVRRITLPEPTKDAITAWIVHRGGEPGPLFLTGDRKTRRRQIATRLSGEGIRILLGALSARALVPRVRPHGLRHAAITTALDSTGGDLRRVQRFSRHADVRMLQVYDDNRTDLGGEVARLVAARLT